MAESGQKAIDIIKSGIKYDIVFMDHMMPEMDGIEATAAIRAWEEEQKESGNNGNLRKQIPIIALTANALAGMKEMFLEKGFNDFITKPIDVFKLDETLVHWIPKEKHNTKTEKKLVLLVDGYPANLRLGKLVLGDKYDVITAPTVKKMFMLLENDNPDLILMNETMSSDHLHSKLPDKIVLITEPFDPAVIAGSIENYFKGDRRL